MLLEQCSERTADVTWRPGYNYAGHCHICYRLNVVLLANTFDHLSFSGTVGLGKRYTVITECCERHMKVR